MRDIKINSVLLKENIDCVSDEKYRLIKKTSKYENKRICDNKLNSFEHYKEKRAYEIVKGEIYKDFSPKEKLIFISNMILPYDELFVQDLLAKDYTKEKLESINEILKLAKKLPKEEQSKVLNCELLAEYSYFAKLYYGINMPHILINKSNEILSKKPNLLIKK